MAADQIDRVECGPITLGFDSHTGQWLELAVEPSGDNILTTPGPMDVAVNAPDHPWPKREAWSADEPVIDRASDQCTVSITRHAPQWSVVSEFRVLSRDSVIQRSAAITWRGDEPITIHAVPFRVPGVSFDGAADALWSLPGNYPFQEHAIPDAQTGAVTDEFGWTRSDTGMAYAYCPSRDLGLVTAYTLDPDKARARVEGGDRGVSLVTQFQTIAVLQPGDQITVGTQWIRIVRGDRPALIDAGADLAARANAGPPENSPPWLDDAVIAEMHPWGRLESWGAGDRGNRMPNIQAQLPYLRDLGVTAVWLLPVSNKPPWVYHLPTFRNIDPAVTTPEGLRSFISAGHDLGIHTLMDLVTYGVSPDSPDIEKLPADVWARDRDGDRQKAWNNSVLCADVSHPDWNRHITQLGSYWVREFGADGFRLDCAGRGQKPNWHPRNGLRANRAMDYGGIHQNALLRDAIRDVNPDAVLMPETSTTAYWRCADLLFDYPLYRACREIVHTPHTANWVRQIRHWLAAQQMTHSMPQRRGLVRFLENHDTVAAQDYFGAGPSQAMTALCTFLPGVLLLHQEQEIGFAPLLHQWLQLRHSLPALRRPGHADYRAVTTDDPLVLPFMRYTDGGACVIAINFGPADTVCTLNWPGEYDTRYPVSRNALTGEPVANNAQVTIPAYCTLVIALSKEEVTNEAPRQPAARQRTTPSNDPLLREHSTREIGGGITRHILQFAPSKQWFVQTTEGLLHDWFIDRHRAMRDNETLADVVPPLARCWRPLEHGYWDGPGDVSMGVIAPDGRAIEVRIQRKSDIRAIRMDDTSQDGRNVWIQVDAAAPAAFTIAQYDDARARLDELRHNDRPSSTDRVHVDPIGVRVHNDHYQAAFARKSGGALLDFRPAPADSSPLRRPSEVYTDWGIYEKGLHASTLWETNPRLSINESADEANITFSGQLRRPPWNGVQIGPVMRPPTKVRISYAITESPAMRVTLGVTPSKEYPDAEAFLAYRIPFKGVATWEVTGANGGNEGTGGADPGKRVFQAADADDMTGLAFNLKFPESEITIDSFSGAPHPPQNPFLLDGADGNMQLFFAILNGQPIDLPANREITASFNITIN